MDTPFKKKLTEDIKEKKNFLQNHIYCVIAVLLLVIFWILAFIQADLGPHIASWVSILLAIVAIVYAFLQGVHTHSVVESGQGQAQLWHQNIESMLREVSGRSVVEDAEIGDNVVGAKAAPEGTLWERRFVDTVPAGGVVTAMRLIYASHLWDADIPIFGVLKEIWPDDYAALRSVRFGSVYGVAEGMSCFLRGVYVGKASGISGLTVSAHLDEDVAAQMKELIERWTGDVTNPMTQRICSSEFTEAMERHRFDR